LSTAYTTTIDFYACLWLADIEKLKSSVDEYLPNTSVERLAMLEHIEIHGKIGQRWQQKDNDSESRAHLLRRHQSRMHHHVPVLVSPWAEPGRFDI
jgi:hypothetical protein